MNKKSNSCQRDVALFDMFVSAVFMAWASVVETTFTFSDRSIYKAGLTELSFIMPSLDLCLCRIDVK